MLCQPEGDGETEGKGEGGAEDMSVTHTLRIRVRGTGRRGGEETCFLGRLDSFFIFFQDMG